jgi:hypothetical protein
VTPRGTLFLDRSQFKGNEAIDTHNRFKRIALQRQDCTLFLFLKCTTRTILIDCCCVLSLLIVLCWLPLVSLLVVANAGCCHCLLFLTLVADRSLLVKLLIKASAACCFHSLLIVANADF